jgi:uncharacterized protein
MTGFDGLRYVALAFGWTWAFWWGAVLLDVPWDSPAGAGLFAVGGVGPVLAAAVLVHRGRYPEPPRVFWRRVVDGRGVAPRWWAAVAGIALLPALVGRVVLGGDGPWLELGALTVLVTGLVAGLLEEPGWRGYLQDALQRSVGPVRASAVVGPVWALWHLPLFFLVGSYQHEVGRWNEQFATYLAAVVAWAFVYAWVYVRSGRSILAVVVLHAAANGAGELVPVDGAERAQLATILVLAVACAWSLARRPAPGDAAHGRAARVGQR